jgi:hypothetical protein
MQKNTGGACSGPATRGSGASGIMKKERVEYKTYIQHYVNPPREVSGKFPSVTPIILLQASNP